MGIHQCMMTALAAFLLAAPFVAAQPLVEAPAYTSGEIVVGDIYPQAVAAVPEERFWFRTDYLLGWFQGQNVGTLVTSSPAGTPKATAGVLGAATTTPLFSDQQNNRLRSGMRVVVGGWFDGEPRRGFEAAFTVMESQASLFNAASGGDPILARPIGNAVTGLPAAILLAFPGESTGSVSALARSGNFYDAALDFTEVFVQNGGFRLESIVGYRFYRYDEGVSIRQAVLPTGPLFVPGTVIDSSDAFSTQNAFHGLDLGLRARCAWDDFTLTLLAKAAAGHITRETNIQGSQVTTVPGLPPVGSSGGVLALSSNIGRHSKNDWGLFPELGANLSWQLNPNVRLRGGYTFLFLHQIARAPDQIDFTINPNLLPPNTPPQPGPNRPIFDLRRSDLWIQSLQFGVEVSF